MNEPILFTPSSQNKNLPVVNIFVAIFFLSIVALHIAAALLGSALSCLGGCNEITAVHTQEIYLNVGLFILAIIEAIGLYKRQYWARMFGIVFGIMLLAPQLIYYITNPSLQSLLFIIINPESILTFIAIIYLSRKGMGSNWESQGNTSTLFALILSVMCFILVTINTSQTYFEIVQPNRQAESIAESTKFRGKVKAGGIYHDSTYGYELTFPIDTMIYHESDSQDPKDKDDLLFSPNGLYSPEGFNVEVENIINNQDSIDSIARLYAEGEPKDKVSRGTVNGIPYVKIVHWTNESSFQYIILHNGKLFRFAKNGGTAVSRFESIFQTLRFTQ